MAYSNIPVPGYPTRAWGSTRVSKVDHFGPVLYPTGGEVMYPASFGMGGLENVAVDFGGFATSQNYFARAVAPSNSQTATENQAPTWNGNNATSQITLQWFYAANSNAVAANTNLAAEVLRLTVFGV